MLKIAFLFLTVGPIAHEDYWRDFFKGNETHYSVYVHAKTPLSADSWFKPHELGRTVTTTWSNTMKAQIELLREALKDPSNEKFVFASENTIPLRPFNAAYPALMDRGESMFYYAPNPHIHRNNTGYAPQFASERNLEPIPPKHQFKNAQWVVLNRKHAQLMVEDQEIIEIATRHGSDQELYPATFLIGTKGLIDEVIPQDMTYVEWNENKTPPYVFTNFDSSKDMELITKAINQGYLFVRKVAPECSMSALDPLLGYRATSSKQKSTYAPTPLARAIERATIHNHEYADTSIKFGAASAAMEALK